MKREIKSEILSTARELFNERGYNAVSMRDIAEALGISVGNLTYHYKRKEELMEAVVEEQYSRYRRTPPPENLQQMNAFFTKILSHQKKNAYYFQHYQQLAQISPRIHEGQQSIVSDFYDSLRNSIEKFRQEGLCKAEQFPDQTELLMDALVSVCVLGTIRHGERRLLCLWSLLCPLLTSKGWEEYHKLSIPSEPSGESDPERIPQQGE